MSVRMVFAAVSASLMLCAQAWASAPPQDKAVQVAVAPAEGGVTVRYRLPAPVRRLEFADTDIVRETWTVTTPGLTLADHAITGETPFDEVEIEVRPDTEERDRIYISLSRAGSGWVVYGPGLEVKDAEATLAFAGGADATMLPARDAIGGYAYVGPASAVSTTAQAEVVIGDNAPPEFADPARQAFFDALAFYERELSSALPFRPAVIVSIDSPGPATFRGDVTDTGVISVRAQGDAWRGAIDQVPTFLWHEAFHLWNGHSVEARDSDSAPWLHEGGAEYAALVGAVSTSGMTEDQARARISRNLDGCRKTLGSRDFDPERLRNGSAPYDCGVLIQWLADLELRRAGTGDVFTLWRDMLTAVRGDPRGYGVEEFRARLVPDSAIAVLLDGPGATRWSTIQSRLADLGATVENRPGDADLMAAALFHVAGQNCKGSRGFFNTPGALRLDGDDCGPLSGRPLIATVEGVDPQADGRAMFLAVQARCAASATVRYRTRDDRELEAVCNAPLALPTAWAVVDAPPLRVVR